MTGAVAVLLEAQRYDIVAFSQPLSDAEFDRLILEGRREAEAERRCTSASAPTIVPAAAYNWTGAIKGLPTAWLPLLRARGKAVHKASWAPRIPGHTPEVPFPPVLPPLADHIDVAAVAALPPQPLEPTGGRRCRRLRMCLQPILLQRRSGIWTPAMETAKSCQRLATPVISSVRRSSCPREPGQVCR